MITISIPTAKDFWKALCLFAYRRWSDPVAKKPTGIPGNRDPDNVCTAFNPRPRHHHDFPCNSDGHYLCRECAHFEPDGKYGGEDEA
jgi:hypothetical protein